MADYARFARLGVPVEGTTASSTVAATAATTTTTSAVSITGFAALDWGRNWIRWDAEWR